MSQSGSSKVTSKNLPPSVPTIFFGNIGSAVASANALNVIGSGIITVTASGDTLTISSGASPIVVGSFTVPYGTSPVNPTVGGVIAFTSNDNSMTITGSLNSIDFKVSNPAMVVENFVTNLGGPVTPNGSNNILTNASTTTFTDGSTANTLKIEVQGVAHELFVGAGTNTPATQIANGSAGEPLISGGVGVTPSYGILTVPGGGTGSPSFNINGIVISNTTTTGALTSLTLTNGQLVIGSTGTTPVATTITAGTGVTITNGPGSITIALAGGSAAVEHLTGDTGGQLNPDGSNNFNLKANSTAGSSVSFSGSGSTLSLNVTDSNDNTIVGLSAGNGSISGTSNTGVGYTSLHDLTSGVNNIAYGYGSLGALTTGSYNNAVGTLNSQSVTTGQQNTSMGNQSLTHITTGSFNTVIGSNTGNNYTGAESSNILVGNAGVLGESNVIRIGTQGSGNGQQNECFIAGITGVTTSNSNLVTVNTSTGQLGAVSEGGFGQTITGDSGGAISPSSGNWNLKANSIAGSSVSFSGSGSTLSLNVTDGSVNTIIGFVAGNGTLSGTNNNAFGQSALAALTSGSQNAAFASSLASLTSGGNNTAIGDSAGNNLKTGSNNILLGLNAGVSYTTSEGSNIIIGNAGTITESNTIRIGTQGSGAGQQNKAFIAGITGVTTSNTQIVTINTSTGQLGAQAIASLGAFTSIVVQTFTSSGTYTPTAGMLYCTIECVGGGGGGGGVTKVATAASGGGGAGGYSRISVSAATIGVSQAVTIGAAGAAGAAGNNNGGTGGTTSVGAIVSATGGLGGTFGSQTVIGIGGNGGTGSSGDINTTGACGDSGNNQLGAATGGWGGSSFFGGGGLVTYAASSPGSQVAGTDGQSYGGGGSGACTSSGTGSNAAGGAGFKGVVVITEYI